MCVTSAKPLSVQQNDMKNPILPENKIRTCIIGGRYYNEINELTELGIKCITIPENKSLSAEISNHADVNCFNFGNGTLLAESGIAGELSKALNNYEIIPMEGIKSPYPYDAGLNAALVGKYLLCNKKYVKPQLLDLCENNGIEIIHTNQGYTKCSVCPINESAVITEDDGIAYLLKNYQFDVLKLTKGFIHLSDVHYGFIGGACGKISDKELYASGDISAHPEYELIKAFADKHGISLIYNKNRPLTDFGGFINII